MSALEKRLIRSINSGNCFALIGAGPSCQAGIPSWHDLASLSINFAKQIKPEEDYSHAIDALKNRKYPSVFSKITEIVGYEELVRFLQRLIKEKSAKDPIPIYSLIVSWPFSSFLTTNFDDLLEYHLSNINEPAVVKKNSESDMSLLRIGQNNTIFKLHGDFSTPEDLVLTEEQYKEFSDKNNPKRDYWRKKIFSLLNTMDVVIIGYSVSDQDFQDQFMKARDISSLEHPIYMFSDETDPEKIQEYRNNFNIKIIPYDNKDGSHKDLERVLRRYSPFIAKRSSGNIHLKEVDLEIAELASNLYIYSQFSISDSERSSVTNSYEVLILNSLSTQKPDWIDITDIKKNLKAQTHSAFDIDLKCFEDSLNSLVSQGLSEIKPDRTALRITLAGIKKVISSKSEANIVNEKFLKSCELYLHNTHRELNDENRNQIIEEIKKGLIRAFQKRGLEIARSILTNETLDVSDSLDLVEIINESGRILEQRSFNAYVDLLQEIVLSPSKEVKSYLALLSQGYFAYHVLGFEPRVLEERKNLVQRTKWLFDSNILISLVAKSTTQNQFAVDLISRAHELGLSFFTTRKLFNEVLGHLRWAIDILVKVSPEDPKIILIAEGKDGFRPNLFIQGYLYWFNTSGNPNFCDYIYDCLGIKDTNDLIKALTDKLNSYGIKVIDFEEFKTDKAKYFEERDTTLVPEIRDLRLRFETFRSDEQCMAEAEAYILCRSENFRFLSLSTILDRIGKRNAITWHPESFYRFLSLFSNVQPNEDLLYSCMVQDFFYSGITIVDEEALKRFASPSIRQARMEIEKERSHFEEILGKERFKIIEDRFDETPDEEKPFFSMQIAFLVAREADRKRKEVEVSYERMKGVKDLTAKERLEFERLRGRKKEKQSKHQRKKRAKRSKK